MRQSQIWLLVGSLIVLFAACDGKRKTSPPPNTAVPPSTTVPDGTTVPDSTTEPDYPQSSPTPFIVKPLVFADADRTAEYLKNGIRMRLASWPGYATESGASSSGGSESPGGATSSSGVADGSSTSSSSSGGTFSSSSSASSGLIGGSSSSASSSGGAGEDFTGTNVHSAGVDEGDWAKYDGKHWFVKVRQGNTYNPVVSESIEVVATDPANAGAKVVGFFQFAGQRGLLENFYLVREQGEATHLAAIRTMVGTATGASAYVEVGGYWEYPVTDGTYKGPDNGLVEIDLIDVSDPTKPTSDWQATIDGSLLQSRKIGNTLYLVTRFDPTLKGIVYGPGNETVRAANEAALAQAGYADLVPHLSVGESRVPLTQGCLLQNDIQRNNDFGSLTHITAIDLASRTLLSSQCLNNHMEVLTMTEKSLYVLTSAFNPLQATRNTIVHKFAISDAGIDYQATGGVAGAFEGNSDALFRMHEFENDFRIITSQTQQGKQQHRLYILERVDDELRIVSELPNSQHPEPIGRANETLRAVRFDDKGVYVEIFVGAEPLYKVDLSNRLDPRIAGKLDSAGVATYMHPVGERYMLTLGQSTFFGGVKAELIDNSGDDPVLVDQLLLGDASFSEVLNNLRAVSILPLENGTVRIALPLADPASGDPSSWSGLKLLEITGADGPNAQLRDAGEIRASSQQNGTGSVRSRVLLHGDAVYLAYDSSIWTAYWGSPETAKGPMLADPALCTTSRANGLEVTLTSSSAQPIDVCAAKVTAIHEHFMEQLQAVPSSAANNSCIFAGSTEPYRFYELKAELAGHRSSSVGPVSVRTRRDICNLRTHKTSLELAPAG